MLIGGRHAEHAYQSWLRELNDGTLPSELRAGLRGLHPPLLLGKGQTEGLSTGIWNDLRFGARLLRKNPGFAMVAIIALALGIGANTTIFQLLDAVRLRTLPVQAPQQLAIVRILNSPHCCNGNHYSPNAALTGALWNLLRDQQKAFSQ